MKTPCVAPEDYGRVNELAPDHPVRLHLEACARCRARYLAYRSFVDSSGAGPTTSERLDEARAALDALIVGQFGLWMDREPVESRESKVPPRRTGAFWQRRWAWVLAPAAGAALVVGFLTLDPGTRSPEPIILRGTGETMFPIEEPVLQSDGSVCLRWRTVEAAVGYRVQLLDSGLRLRAELPVMNDTSLVLSRDEIARHGPVSQTLWRVTAYSGSRKLAESEVGALPDR